MDGYEAMRVVLSRIQSFDPDNASKVMGYLLLQDSGEKEMIRLALGPDSLLRSLVLRVRMELGLVPPPSVAGAGALPAYGSSPLWAAQDFDRLPGNFIDVEPDGRSVDDFLGLQRSRSFPGGGGTFGALAAEELEEHQQWQRELMMQRSRSLRFPANSFAAAAAAYSPSPSPPSTPDAQGSSPLDFSPAGHSGRAGSPFPSFLASRAMARTAALMAVDGGRAAMCDAAARQIYLTFPADSTFTEEDVSNYFSLYGPVQDVRIPYQQKRMFGFVSFVFPETARTVLSIGNPHFVCDARVLVKPYKEKGKIASKKQQERNELSGFCNSPPGWFDSRDSYDLHHHQELLLFRRKLEEQRRAAAAAVVEGQSRRLMGLQLLDVAGAGRSISSSATTTSTSDDRSSSNDSQQESPSPPSSEDKLQNSNLSADPRPQVEDLEWVLQVSVNNGESGGKAAAGNPKESGEGNAAGDDHHHNLPDSPFASSVLEDDPFSMALSSSTTLQ